jgi:hypothetical protein
MDCHNLFIDEAKLGKPLSFGFGHRIVHNSRSQFGGGGRRLGSALLSAVALDFRTHACGIRIHIELLDADARPSDFAAFEA